MSTSYNFDQIIENEEGWLFYDSAFKNWKKIHSNILGPEVLDLGCASGISMSLSKLFAPTLKIKGLEGTNAASEIWAQRGLNVQVGDIYDLPFLDNSFDTVYSSHVLEHLPDYLKVVRESLRVSKRRVIHSVPSGNVDDKNFGSPHIHHFNRLVLRNMAKEVGCLNFEIINVEDIHMSSIVLIMDK